MKKKIARGNGRIIAVLLVLASLFVVAGPGYSDGAGDVSFVFNVENYSSVWDVPFPSDMGVMPDGTINVKGFPNTFLRKTVRHIKSAVANGYGYSTCPTIYFTFNKPLHPSRLPDTLTTLQSGSPIFLVDIDPDSPERGRRFPLRVKFDRKRPRLDFGPKNMLSVLPVPGFALRENTTYAVVIMDTLRDYDHKRLNAPPAFEAMKHGKIPSGETGKKAFEIYTPLFDFLREEGADINRVVAATVFTTGDPTVRLRKVFGAVSQMPPIKLVEPLKVTREYPDFYVLEGAIMFPQFQPGVPPFKGGKGGVIEFDANSNPIVVRSERAPVCVSIPKSKMPAGGWPLMLYIHGTEGISTQFIDRGPIMHDAKTEVAPAGSGPAMIWAHRGIAAVGAALNQNGQRGYDPSMIPYYNFFNIEAMRDNFIQSAAESAMLLRTMKSLKIDSSLCPDTDASASPDGKIYFDPNTIFGMGQSLGSIILGTYGAVETDMKVLFPSGAGIHFGVFVSRMNPFGKDSLREKNEGLGESLGFDIFHPIVTLSQTALAPSDPGSFMRHIIEEPFPGRKAKHVWLSLGQFDHYFSSESQNGVMVGLGLDLVGPVNDASTPEILALAGKKPKPYPVTGNMTAADGSKITGVALQYEQIGALDGHHINFQRHRTKFQYGCFLRSYIDNGVPTLYAPREPWDSPCE